MFPLDMTGTQTCHSDQSSAVKDTVPFATMYEKVSHAVAWRFPKEPSIPGVANGFWLNLGFDECDVGRGFKLGSNGTCVFKM